jgi:hypothetical protein
MPISGMKQGSGKSRFAGLVLACSGIVACVAALAAPAASAEPAVDEYTLTLPQASGDQHLPPGGAPAVTPGAAGAAAPTTSSSPEATDLNGSESGEGLTKKLGEEPELGAPSKEAITPTPLHTSSRGIPEIVADTLTETEGGAPALLAALGAIAAVGVWAAFRRRRSNLRATG